MSDLQRTVLAERFVELERAFDGPPQKPQTEGRLLTDAGRLLIEAHRLGLLSKIPGLADRVKWHTTEKQAGDGVWRRHPGNLWFELVGSHTITLSPNGDGTFTSQGDAGSGLLQQVSREISLIDATDLDDMAAARRRRMATACRVLAGVIHGSHDTPTGNWSPLLPKSVVQAALGLKGRGWITWRNNHSNAISPTKPTEKMIRIDLSILSQAQREALDKAITAQTAARIAASSKRKK